MTPQEASQPNDEATPPAQPSATISQQTNGVATAAKGKGKAKGGAASALDPAVIEAKRRARAQKKEREAREKLLKEEEEQKARRAGLGLAAVDAEGRALYRPRQWALVQGVADDDDDQTQSGGAGSSQRQRRPRIKVLSWNMLAQGLVRRKLFPGSDAMRWKDREAGLGAELLGHGFDVASLQVSALRNHEGGIASLLDDADLKSPRSLARRKSTASRRTPPPSPRAATLTSLQRATRKSNTDFVLLGALPPPPSTTCSSKSNPQQARSSTLMTKRSQREGRAARG